MNRGEFERIAARILWFESLSLEQRLRSYESHREEQRWFDRLRVLLDPPQAGTPTKS